MKKVLFLISYSLITISGIIIGAAVDSPEKIALLAKMHQTKNVSPRNSQNTKPEQNEEWTLLIVNGYKFGSDEENNERLIPRIESHESVLIPSTTTQQK